MPAVKSARPALSHLPQLDGLRALACFWVLVGHAVRSRLDAFLPVGYGGYGVLVFFVLSGFLITRILLVERDSQPSLAGFYLRRAARIFPPYYLMLLAILLFWPGRELLWCAAYIFNRWHIPSAQIAPVAHCWSLAVEEQFYLLWPLIVWYTPRRWTALAASALAVLGTLALWPIFLHTRGAGLAGSDLVLFTIHQTPPQLLALGMGALLACHEAKLNRRTLLILAAGGWLIYWSLPHLLLRTHMGADLLRTLTLEIGGCFWALAVFAAGLGADWTPLRSFLIDSRVRYVGRISYGLYLYHLPVYQALAPLTGRIGPAPAMLAGLATTFAAAALSYRYIEKPFMDAARHRLNPAVNPIAFPCPQETPGVKLAA